MAENRKTLIKAAISLIISICIISACVLSVFGYMPKEKKLEINYSLPLDFDSDSDIVSYDRHQKKFGIYTHRSKTDDNDMVVLFSASQVNEINSQRENGEWLYLTDSEMFYLISDTVSLFKQYDKVCIYDLKGVLHVYDTNVYLKKLVCEAIAIRIEVLCSGLYKANEQGETVYFFMNEQTGKISDTVLKDRYGRVNRFYFEGNSLGENTYKIIQENLKRSRGSAFIIKYNAVYYIDELSRAEQTDIILAY
ncbi:MAG: hypothetical protein IKC74_02300 [Clostridia bacterium]|nr:hypothetical protein [Clostridia bacterium]